MYGVLARIVWPLIVIMVAAVVVQGSQKVHLEIKQLHYENSKLNRNVEFPLALGLSNAAKGINYHLQSKVLEASGFFVDNDTICLHEEVVLPSISYTLYPTSYALLSVRFSMTESGEEDYLESFLFDTRTGKLVALKELFSSKGFADIKTQLSKLKHKRAQQRINHYDVKSLEGETIQGCADQGVKFVRFFLICDTLVLEEERCSGNMHLEHDIAPFYLFPYREIMPYLSTYGKKLLALKGCKDAHDNKANTLEMLHEISEWFVIDMKEIKDLTGTKLLDDLIQTYRNKSK